MKRWVLGAAVVLIASGSSLAMPMPTSAAQVGVPVPTAVVASKQEPDEDSTPERTYRRPSERILYDKRVRDGKTSGKQSKAMEHARINYAVGWFRITDLDPDTVRFLREITSDNPPTRHIDEFSEGLQDVLGPRFDLEDALAWMGEEAQKAGERDPFRGGPRPEITIRTAEEIRQQNPGLYDELRAHGLRPEDVVAQQIHPSTPPKKGSRGLHSEQSMLEWSYILEQTLDGLAQGKTLEQIEQELKPGSRTRYTPKRFIYGVSEREPCSYPGPAMCFRYAELFDYLIPYGTEAERKEALRRLGIIILKMHQWDSGTWAGVPFREPDAPGRAAETRPDEGESAGSFERATEPDSSRALVRQLESADNGGIDFSSLQLRYLAEVPEENNVGIQYAFAGSQREKDATGDVVDGARNVIDTSDAFFVWLALPEQNFWVNLNPNEPDRVVERRLGRTGPGRVMLEADLRLKKTVADIIHPHTKSGKRFWNSLRGAGEEKCFSSRVWITPKPAKVYDEGGELYILDAPLNVRMEQEYIKDTGAGNDRSCPHQSRSIEEHNTAVYDRIVMPRLIHAVNHAPEYAELRRVYLSRVAAEWYRDRAQAHEMTLSDIIDSGDVNSWHLDGDWTPKDTFRRYVQSYEKGEFKVRNRRVEGGFEYTSWYTYGGVDLTEVPRRTVDKATFESEWPGIRDTVAKAMAGAVDDTDQTWFGGSSVQPDKPDTKPEPDTNLAPAPSAIDEPTSSSPDPGWFALGLLVVALLLALLIRQRHASQGRSDPVLVGRPSAGRPQAGRGRPR